MAIIASDPEHRFSVSIELENTFLKPAPVGSKVFIVSNILRMGKAIATADVKFSDQVRYKAPQNSFVYNHRIFYHSYNINRYLGNRRITRLR